MPGELIATATRLLRASSIFVAEHKTTKKMRGKMVNREIGGGGTPRSLKEFGYSSGIFLMVEHQ